MIGEKDFAGDGECSRTKTSKPRFSNLSNQNHHLQQDDKTGLYHQKGVDFLSVRSNNLDGFSSKSSPRSGNELTLSYLCENRDKISESLGQKGKEVVTFSENNSSYDDKWVERDFFNLRDMNPNSSKRKAHDEEAEAEAPGDEEEEDKKSNKIETLNLSLALPDVSLSLTASNAVKRPRVTTSERTTTSFSNDFTATAPSMSYSYSHPFSHNISCSMTRNSTDFDCSVGKDDHIWCAGEGTNGSVHSRFRPIGDGGVALLANNPVSNKPSCSSDYSFFPSELPARPGNEVAISGDSRKKVTNLEDNDTVRSERVLYDIVSKSISSVALIIQGMADETLESAKEYLRNLIDSPEKKEKLTNLQSQIDKRSDLCKETLSKCVKDQLDILVAVRTGLKYFLSGKIRIPMNELVEIFLFLRCRNVNCKSLLPVDDCECKICSNNKGFCSSCMCPVCLRFDSASNTCSWVGCDVCSHWCHAACGIQKNLIKPGHSLKGPRGTTEMMFHCIGCAHKSEMFGFVKDVFVCCAKNWGLETLIKELDCVRKVFRGSEDAKGKALHLKANEMVKKLESKQISPLDASNFIIQFFNYAESVQDIPDPPRELTVAAETSYRKDEASVTPSTAKDQKKKSFALTDAMMNSFDSLESMVRIKEAETRMFQKKADEARIEAESFKRMIEMKTEKMEEEYTEKLARLCLQETEERRRTKLEELKKLENSHCDYRNMKLRMEAEIAGLLKRMEVTRQQLV
ncbi:PREDICTED: protein OBERON 3-like [Camelina sativa]|uniref:Protein OBERON 3-like n=1 Tax=Camelina sativa TaxID=90675 RepID=A0ABM0WUY1_CAMSA|nr:PREDICTED: protein OBERON 3-like [Camelina sativa]